MNRTLFGPLALLIAVLLVSVACQPILLDESTLEAASAADNDAAAVDAETADAETVDAEAGEEFREFALMAEEAYQSQDVDRIIEYYAEDAISRPPGFPTSVGKEAIRTDLQGFFDTFSMERDFTLTDYEVAGDYATRSAEWTQVLTPKDGSEPITEIGRCTLGFKKVDGEWKIAWEIWNTYEPVSQ